MTRPTPADIRHAAVLAEPFVGIPDWIADDDGEIEGWLRRTLTEAIAAIEADRAQRPEPSEASVEAALVAYWGSKRAARKYGSPLDMADALRAAGDAA